MDDAICGGGGAVLALVGCAGGDGHVRDGGRDDAHLWSDRDDHVHGVHELLVAGCDHDISETCAGLHRGAIGLGFLGGDGDRRRRAATTTIPATSGEPGPGCVTGWVSPTRGTALRTDPLDVIREGMGVSGEFAVVEMRYFTGPPAPGLVSDDVFERWYVKAHLADDPTFGARWLVHRWPPGAGIVAAAPFDTTGYHQGDWHSFEGVDWGSEPDGPYAVEGLPGRWSGRDIDPVIGEEGYPELPDEVVGCLDGT